jgi:hypothetical protein
MSHRWGDTPERAVVLIGVLALIVAVVCFGLLQSTGTYSNAGWSLGGSIVGFAASAWVLYRIYKGTTSEGPISKSELKLADFWHPEIAKVWDFRSDVKDALGRGIASLTDYYRVTKESDEDTIVFHYATSGELRTAESLSHPMAEKKEKLQPEAAPAGEAHFTQEIEIRVNLATLEKEGTTRVVNAIEYVGAFEGASHEWMETHIDRPTAHLTFVLLFSEARPCRGATGEMEIGREEPRRVQDSRPEVMHGGRVVYWSLEKPLTSAKYRLRWDW